MENIQVTYTEDEGECEQIIYPQGVKVENSERIQDFEEDQTMNEMHNEQTPVDQVVYQKMEALYHITDEIVVEEIKLEALEDSNDVHLDADLAKECELQLPTHEKTEDTATLQLQKDTRTQKTEKLQYNYKAAHSEGPTEDNISMSSEVLDNNPRNQALEAPLHAKRRKCLLGGAEGVRVESSSRPDPLLTVEPRSRASHEQFSALMEFMERHGDLSRAQAGAAGRLRGERLWVQLTTLLNSIGGGVQKTQDKWKKVWADWKTKTKKKYMISRRRASGTGGGSSNRHTLTALEERVVAILGASAVLGHAGILEQGFHASLQPHDGPIQGEESEVQPVLDVPHVNASPIVPPPPPPAHTPTQPSSTPPPPSLRRTPPLTTGRPASAPSPRRRVQLRARRTRGMTPFQRATREFVAVEHRRLQLEETRETRLHEREMERLRIDSEKIQVSREHNELLRQLGVIAQSVLQMLSQQRPNSLPPTDTLPGQE